MKNTESVTLEIQKMLEKALKSAAEKIDTKTNQLMSEKLELQRQLTQILYTETFIKEQSQSAEALEFINISIGHEAFKNDLIKQWPDSLGPGQLEDYDILDMRDLMEITG